MHVIAKRTLREYWEKHPNIRGALEAWHDHVKRADWATPADLQQEYGSDAVLPDNRAVFKLRGNQYRLVVRINYATRRVYVRFIGTHAEYDRIDVMSV